MGIEPTGTALPGLERTLFDATVNTKCDLRVNLRGMWGNVRLHRDRSMCEVSASGLSVVGGKFTYENAKQCAAARLFA
jgi:hypothetical protein